MSQIRQQCGSFIDVAMEIESPSPTAAAAPTRTDQTDPMHTDGPGMANPMDLLVEAVGQVEPNSEATDAAAGNETTGNKRVRGGAKSAASRGSGRDGNRPSGVTFYDIEGEGGDVDDSDEEDAAASTKRQRRQGRDQTSVVEEDSSDEDQG